VGRGALTGWVEAATPKAVSTLKLALKLYVELMQKGLDADRFRFAQSALAGTLTTEMDNPDARLDALLTAELAGLPATFVDDLPAQVRALTLAQVNAAITRRVHAHDLAITVVATASVLRPLLLDDKVQPGAIDVVPYDAF
jgi:predicted Zn-dependent peptidase